MVVFHRRIMGIETEYGITATVDPQRRQLGPDEVARELFKPVVAEYSSSNIFLPNASRLYLDVGSHPEVATGECDSLSQLLAYERAGDAIVDDLARQAERSLDATVYLFKNNVDSAGNSYGCHENYLISREVVLKDLSRSLLPFLITRQLICGAGMVAPATATRPAQFVLSQRADQVWEGVSSATTRSRPIINTRDEPHGDSKRFRRMHVIVGDSNMAEPSFALKVGSMLLMLEMLEAGFELPNLEVADPIVRIRDIARDIDGSTELELVAGGTLSALEVQRQFHAAAARWLEHRPDGDPSQEDLARVVALWGRVLDAIGSGNYASIAADVDWAAKLALLERYRERLGGDWAHPKLAQVDLAYHDIRPGRGLADVLVRRGMLNRWIGDAAITRARDSAPPTTRAWMRGQFLEHARAAQAHVTVDWTRMKIHRPEVRVEEFLDPFDAASPRLDALLNYIDEHAANVPE
ncbi:Pup--protein ligase [Corynebacterium lizhenjunii]|nr:Pup--protein ligase [Corynebacterium lizhenjunii]